MEETNLSSVNAESSENVVDSQQTEPTEQIESTNNESSEVVDTQVETKVQQSAEENAKFASIRREYEAKIAQESQKAIDAEYDRLYGQEYNIHSKADYDEAIALQQQQDREDAIRQEYESKGVPEELLEELVASKRDREEREKEKQVKAEEAKKQAEYLEFFDYFKDENGRDFDSTKDVIPQDVWELVNKGKTLTDAYAINHTKELKERIAELEGKQKAEETNQLNSASSTGSLTGNGSTDNGFISYENFEANKSDQRWVIKNLTKIQESRAKW